MSWSRKRQPCAPYLCGKEQSVSCLIMMGTPCPGRLFISVTKTAFRSPPSMGYRQRDPTHSQLLLQASFSWGIQISFPKNMGILYPNLIHWGSMGVLLLFAFLSRRLMPLSSFSAILLLRSG